MKVRKSNELILSFFVNTDTSSDKKAGNKYRLYTEIKVSMAFINLVTSSLSLYHEMVGHGNNITYKLAI